MISSLLEFLSDSNLQKTFLVLGCIFTFLGISGLTWRTEKLGCFPRFIFTLLGFGMLIGSGMGYFEKKDKYFSEKKWRENYNQNIPASPSKPSKNSGSMVRKTGRDDNSNNIIGDYGTIITRNNSDDYITYEGNRVYMRNSNNKTE